MCHANLRPVLICGRGIAVHFYHQSSFRFVRERPRGAPGVSSSTFSSALAHTLFQLALIGGSFVPGPPRPWNRFWGPLSPSPGLLRPLPSCSALLCSASFLHPSFPPCFHTSLLSFCRHDPPRARHFPPLARHGACLPKQVLGALAWPLPLPLPLHVSGLALHGLALRWHQARCASVAGSIWHAGVGAAHASAFAWHARAMRVHQG